MHIIGKIRSKFKTLFAIGAILAAFAVVGVMAQQSQYGNGTYHGPFSPGTSYSALNFLGHYFEYPQVTAGTATYIQWTRGAVYPDGLLAGGIQVWGSAPTGFLLDASKTACSTPSFASCDIAFVPYQSATGTVTGTFTIGELATQATSNATAYVLSATTAGVKTVYFSKTISGTPDATHTWTGGSSSATLASPTSAPTNANGEPVLVTTAIASATLPGATIVAYLETNSSSVPTVITYPYQLAAGATSQAVPVYQTAAGGLGPQIHEVLITGAVGTGVTLSGVAVYTGATTFACAVSDTTASHAAWAQPTSGTAITIGGTGTDAVVIDCRGY